MSKLSHRQRIDRAHETRMWIKDVIIPAGTALVLIDRMNPILKYKVGDWFTNKKRKIEDVFHKRA